MTQPSKPRIPGELVWGALLIVAGALFFLHNIHVLHVGPLWSYWPLIPVLIGIAKLLQVRDFRDIGPGIWWIFIGLWLFVSIHEMYGLAFSNSWPLLIVAWGISILWQAVVLRKPRYSEKEDQHE